MNRSILRSIIGGCILLLFLTVPASGAHWSPPSESPNAMHVAGLEFTVNGSPAQPGDEIAVFDIAGNIVGHFIVETEGMYGDMAIFGDYSSTPVDEGASANEFLSVKVWRNATSTEYSGASIQLVTPSEGIGPYTPLTLPLEYQNDVYFLMGVRVNTLHTISVSALTGGSISCNPAQVPHGGSTVCTVDASPGHTFSFLTDNGTDVTSQMSGNAYTIQNITTGHLLAGAFVDTTLSLAKGWNFVSFPRIAPNTTISEVLKDISSDVVIVWGYENRQKEWSRFRPDIISGNSLQTIESGKGYWICMNGKGVMNMTDWAISRQSPTLFAGWNLVGYNGIDGANAVEALKGLNGLWIAVWNWNNGEWRGKFSNIWHPSVDDMPAFDQKKAYWVKTVAGTETEWVQK